MFSKNTPTQCLYVHTLVHCSVVIAARFGRLLFSLGWRRMCSMDVCVRVCLSLSRSVALFLFGLSKVSHRVLSFCVCGGRYVSVCMCARVCCTNASAYYTRSLTVHGVRTSVCVCCRCRCYCHSIAVVLFSIGFVSFVRLFCFAFFLYARLIVSCAVFLRSCVSNVF